MQRFKKYSEVALASLLITACGGGDNGSNITPINSGVPQTDTDNGSVAADQGDPVIISADVNASDSTKNPETDKESSTGQESEEDTAPIHTGNAESSSVEKEDIDNTSPTPPSNNEENKEGDVADNTASQPNDNSTGESNTQGSESPTPNQPPSNTPTLPYTPKDPNRIFDEADKFTQPHGEIEALYPQQYQAVNDQPNGQKVAVIDVDFSATDDTGGAFLPTNKENRLLLNRGIHYVAKGNKNSHGTMAAGVIALKNQTVYIYGYTAKSTDSDTISATNQHYEAAREQGVRIFNNSHGNTPTKDWLEKNGGWKYFVDRAFYPMLAAWAAKDSIFIWAAGNDGQKSYTGQNQYATTESHIPVINDDARRGWITVAAVDWDGRHLMPYSSQVGETAKTWGIAARGDWSLFNGTVSAQGTSFAAPEVTAAVAKVWDKFPWMSNHLATQTILSTANKLNSNEVTDGPNAQVGWGVLNEDRALKGPARFDTRLLVRSDNGFVTVNFDHRNYNDRERLTWSNDIAGDAGFKKQGTGTLYLSGNNRYTGQTIVEGGTLVITKALTQSEVTIEKNGTLLANGEQQAVQIGKSVNNNGSLEVYGKGLTINENYTAERDARTVIDIHTAMLNVEGTADMQNSRILAHVEKINDVPTQTEQTRTILKADRLENYQGFYTISDKIAPYIEVSRIVKNGNQVDATYKRNQTEYVLRSLGSVSRSAANTSKNLDKVLDEVAENPNSAIKSDSVSIITATPLAVAQTVDSLSAEIYASSQNLVLSESRTFSEQVANRAVNTVKSEVYAATNYREYRLAQTGYAKADTKGTQSHIGATYKTDNGLLGLAVYQSQRKAEFDRATGNSKLRQQGVSVYAGYDWNENYLLAQVGIANAKNNVKRSVLIPNSPRNIKTDFDTKLYSFYGETGHRVKFDSAEITPFIGYQWDSLIQKAFNEGQYFGIQADRTRHHIHSYVIGVRAGTTFGDLSLNAELTHRYTPNTADKFGFKARYIGSQSVADIQGISPSEQITRMKVGVNYSFTPTVVLSSVYTVSHQRSGVDHDFNIGMTYRF